MSDAAADDPQPPVLVEVAEVAGVQPAVIVERVRREVRAADHDLTLVEAQLDPVQREPERRDLRAALGHPVARARPARPRSLARSSSGRGIGPPPSSAQRSVGGRSRPASSSRASIVGTSETSVTAARRIHQFGQHRLGVEALVQDHGRRVERRAQQDREPADVGERHHAQPALVQVEPERERRADRVRLPVAAASDRPAWAPRSCPR